MSRFAKRVDGNHSEIIAAYERLGVCVLDLSRVAELTRPGCPDLLCSLHGFCWFSETKTDVGELNPAQVSFMAWWKAPCKVVRSVDDVIAIVKDVKTMTGAGKFVRRVGLHG